MRRLPMLLLCGVLALFGTGLAFGATAPSAAASDGCSFSPDSGYHNGAYYNFYNACFWHDMCYANHYYGDGEAGRKACDEAFLADMNAWCDDYYASWWEFPQKSGCRTTAWEYYLAVRAFGGGSF